MYKRRPGWVFSKNWWDVIRRNRNSSPGLIMGRLRAGKVIRNKFSGIYGEVLEEGRGEDYSYDGRGVWVRWDGGKEMRVNRWQVKARIGPYKARDKSLGRVGIYKLGVGREDLAIGAAKRRSFFRKLRGVGVNYNVIVALWFGRRRIYVGRLLNKVMEVYGFKKSFWHRMDKQGWRELEEMLDPRGEYKWDKDLTDLHE